MKTYFIIITIISLFLTHTKIIAQTEVKTPDGKSVMLNQDGTWHYIETDKSTASVGSDINCSDYVETNVDKMTGAKSFSSKKTLIVSQDGGKNGFGILLITSGDGTIIFNVTAAGAGNCIDAKSKMNILFRDGTKTELLSDNKFNCDASYTKYFGGPFGGSKELESLKSKEIETMRVWTSKSYVQEDFNKEQSKTLMETFKCISNSIK